MQSGMEVTVEKVGRHEKHRHPSIHVWTLIKLHMDFPTEGAATLKPWCTVTELGVSR